MSVIGRVNHIQGYTPFDIKTVDSNVVKNIGKTYYPVTVFFQGHEALGRLLAGKMMVGSIMESATHIPEPSIRDIELYHPYMGESRIEEDQSGTIMITTFMVKGSMIFNNWVKEHAFYEIKFLIHDLIKDRKVISSPDEFVTTFSELDRDRGIKVISFGLLRVRDEDSIK